MKRERVVIAMSGGVDSSVAAWLLKKQGYEVIGVTMCFNISHTNRRRPSCCGVEGIEDAKRVAEKIDISHYVLNFNRELENHIINNFCREYLKGRTPNPCIRCNQFLKFDSLLKKARMFGAKFLATGHYAQVVYNRRRKRFILKKAKDRQKDQSYFLYSIKKRVLPYILMPLGNYTKREVRNIAERIGLKIAQKRASQEICFVDTDYRRFLRYRLSQMGIEVKPGPIIDTKGRILGQHQGVCFYTLGQRQGLGLALGYRAYIVKIDVHKNSIVLGKEQELYSKGLIAEQSNFICIDFPHRPIFANVKIRYNHIQIPCRIIPLDRRRVKVEFFKPQKAVTPGQSAVFYHRDKLLGGGIIQKALSR
jgi:tRNA-specific 2-thiouridylase